MPSTRYTPGQFGDACAALYDIADELPRLEYDARRAALDLTADGYPTSSGFDRSTHSTIVDDEGVPMPPLNDPVGELVVAAATTRDPFTSALNAAWNALLEARRHADHARGLLLALTTVPEEAPADDRRDCCSSCLRIEQHSPVYREAGPQKLPLCRRCYDWWLANRRTPPKGVVQCWADGKRLTTRIVEAALADEMSHPPRRVRA